MCYGLFMVSLKVRNREKRNKSLINIVKKVKGLQPNAQAIVPLVTLKWTKLTTHIDEGPMIFCGK